MVYYPKREVGSSPVCSFDNVVECGEKLRIMEFGELTAGTEIDVEVKVRHNECFFQRVIVQMVKGVALLEPLYHEGKLLDLTGDGVSVNISIKDEKADIPLQFRGCVAKNLRLQNKVYLAVTCSNESKRVNRRDAFRVFVGEQGTIELAGKSKWLDVTVRDLSLTGFSFVTSVSDWDDEISVVWLDFPGRYGEKMRMQGSVVRINEGERERLIVGCRILKCANDIATYVSFKQRENLKRFADKRE